MSIATSFLTRPELFHHVANWPANGEIGQMAAAEDHAIGACWLRYSSAEDTSCLYVSDAIPDLSLAVAAGGRGRGVGRLLLGKTADQAARAGVTRMSLSLERANRAFHLYESEGYHVVQRRPDAERMMLVLRAVRSIEGVPPLGWSTPGCSAAW